MEPSVAIGERLKEARDALKLNQTAFAALAGTSRQTQSNYEKGERMPDAIYLATIAHVGVDVQYVLTGVRARVGEISTTVRESLSPKEQAIVEMFRTLDTPAQYEVEAAVMKEKQLYELRRTVAELRRKVG